MKTINNNVMLVLFVCGMLVFAANIAAAGTITHFGFTDDLSSQISDTKTYTHAVDFGNQASYPLATVNGVAFVPRSGVGIFPAGGSATIGTGWADIPNAHPGTGGNAVAATGDVGNLVRDFNYNNNNAQIRLSGLTVGQTYDLRLYHRIWGGNRTQDFSFTTDPTAGPEDTITFNPDNHGGAPVNVANSEFVTSYQYTASSPYLTIGAAQAGDGTYHAYGLTNEIVGSVVETQVIDGLFNTGVDGSGVKVASGSNDSHFTITELGGVAVSQPAIVVDRNGAWVSEGQAGKYISSSGNRSGPDGITTYETTFELLDTLDPETAQITGFWATDNQGVEILLNDEVVVSGNNQFLSLDYFEIGPDSPFVTGENTLAFRVNNAGAGDMGLVVTDIFGTAQLVPPAVPEPSTFALAALGLLGFAAFARRRKG